MSHRQQSSTGCLGLWPNGATARRGGLSLLEVMIALAILGGAIAVIGELVRLGARSAAEARDAATAQVLCDTIMAELAVGILPLQSISQSPVDSIALSTLSTTATQTTTLSSLAQYPDWVYSIVVEPIDDQGLLAVQTIVERISNQAMPAYSFTLVRWMLDPSLEYAEQEAELAAAEEAAAASSTSTTPTAPAGGGTNAP